MAGHKDDELILAAVREAQEVLAQYVAPGGPSAEEAMRRLVDILNDEMSIEALARKGGPGRTDLRTV